MFTNFKILQNFEFFEIKEIRILNFYFKIKNFAFVKTAELRISIFFLIAELLIKILNF